VPFASQVAFGAVDPRTLTLRRRMFSGFAPLREDDDVVPVKRARPID
jgi:hypothetical protein